MTQTTPNEPSERRRTPRWIWVALIVSIAINLVVVGIAAAAIMKFRQNHTWTGQFQQFVKTLPSDRQAALSSILDDQRSVLRPLRRKSHAARRRARAAFSAEPFDRAKLVAAYEDAAAARQEMTRLRSEWYAKVATLLTAQERKAYLKWRRDHRRKRGRWHHRHRDESQ